MTHTDLGPTTHSDRNPSAPENLSYPRTIGPYRLLGVLGAGGMGDVYLAQQGEPLQRKVALKIIRYGRCTKDVMTRFETERRALALMNHPYIAQVYDAGSTDDGRPYFVMECVDGLPINQYCDEHELSLEDRLWLIRRVCEAVHHAHQRGIIHRDLKPSNILVIQGKGGFAIPKVIDFGVAKAIGSVRDEMDADTLPERVVGTLHYMSPEQMEGSEDVDIRTDVYAIGVLLFELLVGRLPFQVSQKGGLLLAHQILNSIPELPSTLAESLDLDSDVLKARGLERRGLVRALKGDLDWIVMKALNRDRDQRYGSVLELEAELRNTMNHHPVAARPPKVGYRMRKWIMRHRLVSFAIGAALISVVVGTAAIAAAYSKTERERLRAVASEARALEALDRAEKLEARANTVNGFLIDMIGEPNPEEGSRDVRVMQVVEAAEKSLVDDDDWSDEERAALHEAMGRTYVGLGEFDRAITHLRSALKFLSREEEWRERLNVKVILSRPLFELGRFEEGMALLREVVESQPTQGADDIMSRAHNNMSFHFMTHGQFREAEHHLRQSREYALRIYDEQHHEVVTVDANLGVLLMQMGDNEAAEPVLRRVLDIYLVQLGKQHPNTLTQMNNLGSVLSQLNKLDEASSLLKESYEIQRQTLGDAHPNTLGTLNNYVKVLSGQERYEEALQLQRELVTKAEQVLGNNHPNSITTKIGLAQIQIAMKATDDARHTLDIVEPHLAATFPPEHYRYADILLSRAMVDELDGHQESALAFYDRALNQALAAGLPPKALEIYSKPFLAFLEESGDVERMEKVKSKAAGTIQE
ncbi:MAG: serine/threonine protein kinase [Acidobacteria bacterium]|nr:serine/threonine protein kinase [Acidobacteriota bacterium]